MAAEKTKNQSKPEAQPKNFRKFSGVVVSNKMDKTVVVKIDRSKIHPVYKKRFKMSKNFKAHDSKNQYQVGDVVEIIECRPLSKDKRWRVSKKLK